MQHLFLTVGGLGTAAFCLWPVVGDQRLPIFGSITILRLTALLFLMAALVVWDVKRRHALAEIEKVHGIRVAEVPSAVTPLVGSLAVVVLALSFLFEQHIAFTALVSRNEQERRLGALAFLEKYPQTDLIDAAFDYLLEGEDYLDVAAKVYPSLVPDLRDRAALRVLDRTDVEPPGKAGCDLATFINLFEGADMGSRARKHYAEKVVPRYMALPPDKVPPGARAMLRALAESSGPRVGLVCTPAKDVPPPVEQLVGRIQRIFMARAPYQVIRGTGAEFVPRRYEVRWERTGDLLTARVLVVASLAGGPTQTLAETRYTLDLADKDPHAADLFAESPIRDVLPPP